jgi:hypothetical protein
MSSLLSSQPARRNPELGFGLDFPPFLNLLKFAISPFFLCLGFLRFRDFRQRDKQKMFQLRLLPLLFQVSRSLSLSLYTYDWYYLLNKDDDDDDTSYFDVFTLRKGRMKKRMIPFDSATSKTLWSINPSHSLKLAALLDRLTWRGSPLC